MAWRETPRCLSLAKLGQTRIDGTPPPLCLPSRWMKSLSFSPSFCCSFNLSKKERWTQKSILGGIWRWTREKEGVWGRRGEEQRSLRARLNGWEGALSSGRSSSLFFGNLTSRRPPPSGSSTPFGWSSGRGLIGFTHRVLARGLPVNEVLPPSGLVADMVVGVCLESVHYHECQHACFNQEPSSIPNTALLNGKTFQHFNCNFFPIFWY